MHLSPRLEGFLTRQLIHAQPPAISQLLFKCLTLVASSSGELLFFVFSVSLNFKEVACLATQFSVKFKKTLLIFRMTDFQNC